MSKPITPYKRLQFAIGKFLYRVNQEAVHHTMKRSDPVSAGQMLDWAWAAETLGNELIVRAEGSEIVFIMRDKPEVDREDDLYYLLS